MTHRIRRLYKPLVNVAGKGSFICRINNRRMQSPDHDMPMTSLRSFIEDLENSIAVAQTLVEAGHAIDLTGFDRLVGLLCAQVLDLPPEDAGLFKDDLSGCWHQSTPCPAHWRPVDLAS